MLIIKYLIKFRCVRKRINHKSGQIFFSEFIAKKDLSAYLCSNKKGKVKLPIKTTLLSNVVEKCITHDALKGKLYIFRRPKILDLCSQPPLLARLTQRLCTRT